MTTEPIREPEPAVASAAIATTIRDRVPDLGEPGDPGDVAGVAWRRPTLGDAPAIRAVANLAAVVDHPEFRVPLHEISDAMSSSWIDLDEDWIVGELDGRIVAYGSASLSPGQVSVRRVGIDGAVAPEVRRRGIGTALLAWQERRAVQLLRRHDEPLPAEIQIWASEGTAIVPVAERAGYEVARWFIDLHRDLSQPVEPMDDGGLTITTLTPELHEATRIAKNDSFRDHWGSEPTTEERWGRFMAGAALRPDLSALAIEGEGEDARVVGFVVASHDPDDAVAAGYTSTYVELVGIVRDRRGRGIAPRLLTRTLEAARSAGLERAVLDVDSDSPTGAVGLYERLGFTTAKRSIVLQRSW